MMKKYLYAFASLASSLAIATPTVNVTSVATNSVGELVVQYTLSEEDAIITCETFVDGVSVGRLFRGDVNRRIAQGSRTITWSPAADGVAFDGDVTAQVKAWTFDNPPDYMAVDLTMPNCRRYYASAELVPLGVTNYLYKTSVMLFRKIPAKDVVWRMGQDSDNCAYSGATAATVRDKETAHMVKLTEDYYIGVYEMTRKQYTRLTGFSGYSTYSASEAGAKAAFDLDLLPADYISYMSLRGDDSASFANWPDAGHTVATTSTIYKIRSFTGITTLDLPTEAQWEYACRAGTATSLNSGKNVTSSSGYDANLAEVGWQLDGIAKIFPGSKMTCPVGMLQPNNWGLYDMHGNLFERCLDRYVTTGDDYRATFATGWADGAVTVDPEGPSTGDTHICRGGSFFYLASHGRSAARTRYANRAVAGQNDGVRFVCTLPVETAE